MSRAISFVKGSRSPSAGVTAARACSLARLGSSPFVLDVTTTFRWTDYDKFLVGLSGEHDSHEISSSVGLSAFHRSGGLVFQPRISVTYGKVWTESHILQTELLGQTLRLRQPPNHFDFGSVGATLEVSSTLPTAWGWTLQPYAESGVDWEFERPNRGWMLTGDLDRARSQALTGSLKLGLRARITPATTLTTSAALVGIGSGGLEIWEWRLYASRRF